MVGRDIIDRIGGRGAGVDHDGVLKGAIEIGLDAEVEIGLRAGNRRSEVAVARADLDDGGVVAIDLDDRWRVSGGRRPDRR